MALKSIIDAHQKYQDSMLGAFELHLRDIVATAQGRVIASLARKLTMTDGAIDATPANYRLMRSLDMLFMAEMDRAGYPQLVQAFVGEFNGTLQFLDETLRTLPISVPPQAFARNDAVLGTFQLSAADALEDVVRGVASVAMHRSMMSVGGLEFGALVESLTEKFQTSIGKARTIADSAMSTFYRTAADRAYQIIEKDVPELTLSYAYSGPVDKLERPFCRHLTDAGKSYTREEIGKMNNGQIPNVFISAGGWNCRHCWVLAVSQEPAAKVEEGVHYRVLNSDLSDQKTREVLSALEMPELVPLLAKHPIKSISIERYQKQSVSAFYEHADQSIVVSSARKLGVHFGEPFIPGRTERMSAATMDKTESMRRALLQETAHHMEVFSGTAEIMLAGFHNPARKPITIYATKKWREYFAESFVAYFVERKALMDYDPVGGKMVTAVLDAASR